MVDCRGMKLCKDNLIFLTYLELIKYDLNLKVIKKIHLHISNPSTFNITNDNIYATIRYHLSTIEMYELETLTKMQTIEAH